MSRGHWAAGAAMPPKVPLRPEWADLGRLGRRLLRGALTAARAEDAPSLPGLLAEHLGAEAGSLPVVSEQWPPYEHVNVQTGLEHYLARPGREHRLIGVTGFQHRMFTVADLAQGGGFTHGTGVGGVAMVRLPSGPGGSTRACVQCGLYLIRDGASRLALLLRGTDQRGPQESLVVEVLCQDPAVAAAALEEIRGLADEYNVFRGQVLSFAAEMFGPHGAVLNFLDRPVLARDGLILPARVLEGIEEHVLGVTRHAGRLLASGQHLKRGLLLHGPPGTGKTHTVRYLIGHAEQATVIILTGGALSLIRQACSIARALTPAIVVVEDVDLIAEERSAFPGQHPLLFELLNATDGLADDVDVTFVLTTNRVDLLEPALAARPGRVDQAVAFELPDADARGRLLRLYQGRLRLDHIDLGPIIQRTEGVTASFLKELLRKAALIAAAQSANAEGEITVNRPQLEQALDELLTERNTTTRVLLGGSQPAPAQGSVRQRQHWGAGL